MHSHDYRVPEPFSGQNVLCIGAGSSGVDIALEIAELANQVRTVLNHKLIFIAHSKRLCKTNVIYFLSGRIKSRSSELSTIAISRKR